MKKNVGLQTMINSVFVSVRASLFTYSTPAADNLKTNVDLLYTAYSVFACVRASHVVIYVVCSTVGETGASPHTFAI